MVTYLLKVVGIRKETEDTFTISIKQPGLKKIKYLPGQYLTVIVEINNRKYKRPYSFSSAPGIDSHLEITVKRVLHGIVSNHLIDVIKENDMLEVIPPMGTFVYDELEHKSKQVHLWGAGSGITPLMSILKYALSSSTTNITMNICNRSKKETIFYEQLIILQEKYPDNFKLNMFCTQESNIDTISGRISDLSVINILQGNVENTVHFICGPLGLKNAVKKGLNNLNVISENIYSEDFDHFVSDVDLEGVITQTLEIFMDDKRCEVEIIRGKSILEACLDYGLEIPYSCQNGTCGLCKAKLIRGELKTLRKDQTDTSKSNEDEYLLCCSYPLNNQIILKID